MLGPLDATPEEDEVTHDVDPAAADVALQPDPVGSDLVDAETLRIGSPSEPDLGRNVRPRTEPLAEPSQPPPLQ